MEPGAPASGGTRCFTPASALPYFWWTPGIRSAQVTRAEQLPLPGFHQKFSPFSEIHDLVNISKYIENTSTTFSWRFHNTLRNTFPVWLSITPYIHNSFSAHWAWSPRHQHLVVRSVPRQHASVPHKRVVPNNVMGVLLERCARTVAVHFARLTIPTSSSAATCALVCSAWTHYY